MKNDDAALVKEMKSGWRGMKNRRIYGDEAVYRLRSKVEQRNRGLIRSGSEITLGCFEK